MEQGREGALTPFELGDEGNNLEFVPNLSDDRRYIHSPNRGKNRSRDTNSKRHGRHN